jgi:hypothetical protein
MTELSQVRARNPEWTNFIVFNGTPQLLFQTVEVQLTEIAEYTSLFADYDTTVTRGLTLNNVHYHAHRFYEKMIYGRADPRTKRMDGFCLYRTPREGKRDLYVLVTYDLPNVSARIIPALSKQIEAIKADLP